MKDNWQRRLNRLLDLAEDLAEAKAHLHNMENVKKTIVSVAMKESGETAIGAQEREAYASESYIKWTSEYRDALKKYESLRLRMRVGETWFEMVRTEEATNREEMRLAR